MRQFVCMLCACVALLLVGTVQAADSSNKYGGGAIPAGRGFVDAMLASGGGGQKDDSTGSYPVRPPPSQYSYGQRAGVPGGLKGERVGDRSYAIRRPRNQPAGAKAARDVHLKRRQGKGVKRMTFDHHELV